MKSITTIVMTMQEFELLMNARIVLAILTLTMAVAGCTQQTETPASSQNGNHPQTGPDANSAGVAQGQAPSNASANSSTSRIVYNFTGTITGTAGSPLNSIPSNPIPPSKEDKFNLPASMRLSSEGFVSGFGSFRWEIHSADGRVVFRTEDAIFLGPGGIIRTDDNGPQDFFVKPAPPGDYSVVYYVDGTLDLHWTITTKP